MVNPSWPNNSTVTYGVNDTFYAPEGTRGDSVCIYSVRELISMRQLG